MEPFICSEEDVDESAGAKAESQREALEVERHQEAKHLLQRLP